MNGEGKFSTWEMLLHMGERGGWITHSTNLTLNELVQKNMVNGEVLWTYKIFKSETLWCYGRDS